MPANKNIDLAVTPGKITVVCHGCGARYKVKDATVRGHRFRAVCKRCGGIIVARCTEAFAVLPEQDTGTAQPRSASPLDQRDLHHEDQSNWYVVIDKKPHGPMTSDQVRSSYAAKQIFSKSYMWRAGEPEWRHLFDCLEFKELFYDPKTTLYRQPDDQGDEGGLSEEAAQFLRRRLTTEGQVDDSVSEWHSEHAEDYDRQGGEADYLAEDFLGMPVDENPNPESATAFLDSRNAQDSQPAGYLDATADEVSLQPPLHDPQFEAQRYPDQAYPDRRYPDQAYPDQRYPDQRYPDQRYPDQRYPDQAYPDQGYAADSDAPEAQGRWEPAPEPGQPWSPPEPEPRRRAMLPAPTGAPQRDFSSVEENRGGDLFTRPLRVGDNPAPLVAPSGPGRRGDSFSSAPSLSTLTKLPGGGSAPGGGPAPGGGSAPGGGPAPGGGSALGGGPAPGGPLLFNDQGFGGPGLGGSPGLPVPVKSVFEDGLKPIAGPVLNNSNFLMAVEDEPFLTTGKIIALAAVGGGLFVALTVVLVVSLVRPAKEIPVVSGSPLVQGQKLAPLPVQNVPLPSHPKEVKVKIAPASREKGSTQEIAAEKTPEKTEAPSKTERVKSHPQVVMKAVKVKPPQSPRKVAKPTRPYRRPVKRIKDKTEVDSDDLLAVESTKPKKRKPATDEVDDLLAVAPKPKPRSNPTPPVKTQSSSEGLPVQPSKESIRAAMRSALPRIRSCHDKHQQTGTIKVSLTIRGNGTADVDIVGAFAGTPTGFCVLGALERRTFPKFTGNPVKLVYPFQLQ